VSNCQLSINNYQLPEGYKQTEVGVIPEDWEVKPLGDFISLQRGYDLTARERRPGNIPVMGAAGQNGFHSEALVEGPGIVLGRSGASYGQVHYCESDYWPHNTGLYATDLHGNDPLFTFYFLDSLDFSRYNSGGAQQSLNRNFIYPILIAIPDVKEQRAIATTLSDVDALIAALDQLIAKQRHLKTATMQQLLTGKKRLPGFGEEWNVYSIEEICRNVIDYRGRTPKKIGMEWGGGDIPALSANNVKMGLIDLKVESYLGSEELYEKWMKNGDPQKEDIVFTMEAPLGNVALIPNDKKYILSQRVILMQTHQTLVANRFLVQLIMSSQFQLALSQDSSGSTATGIQRKKLEKISLSLPPLEEQREIATVLSDMDDEIAAIEARRAKTQAIKQGMMQQLLTGKVRLLDKGINN
jgi:type I restriction enzyme S subunit